MANKHRGEVPVELDGVAYTMVPTYGALAQIEDDTGVGLLYLSSRISASDLRVKDIVAVIYHGISASGANISRTVVGNAVLNGGCINFVKPLSQFLSFALTGESPSATKSETDSGNV